MSFPSAALAVSLPGAEVVVQAAHWPHVAQQSHARRPAFQSSPIFFSLDRGLFGASKTSPGLVVCLP